MNAHGLSLVFMLMMTSAAFAQTPAPCDPGWKRMPNGGCERETTTSRPQLAPSPTKSEAAPPLTARMVAQLSLPSVVLLIMSDANGQPIALGSGFSVMDGVVATNVHVIAGAAQGRVKVAGQSRTYSVTGTVGIDETNDLALLKVTGQTAPALVLGQSDSMSVGDDVYVAGNPEGLEGTLSSGIVSAVRQVQEHKLLQITAPISPGSSGGPVLNAQGEVIGIAVATFRGGQNLNFAVPSSYLITMLANIRSVSPLTANSKHPSSAIDALGGNVTDAIQITHRKVECSDSGFGGSNITFSIRNSLPHAITNVRLLFVFRDKSGDPVDYFEGSYSERIPPGLAKAVVGPYLKKTLLLAHFPTLAGNGCWELSGEQFDLSFIEIRILGFRIFDETDPPPILRKRKQ